MAAVVDEKIAEDGGWDLEIKMNEQDFDRFMRRENLPAGILQTSSEPVHSWNWTYFLYFDSHFFDSDIFCSFCAILSSSLFTLCK